ncbi:uncharacterized protein LOC127079577 [Lathyrus oleraceus]|uniref:uncharacterized protein LOC127079577 n=1 Tax=Pisum sativum TaxID=3888 RepID=UPI0021CE160D|nr:uncharacterized protein LOC127079577 [Pisum sativum]
MFESNHNDNNTNNRNTTTTNRDFDNAAHSLSSSTVFKPEFHPDLGVSNIKNRIPIVLKMEKDQHGTWAELFRIRARSYWILHHIVPYKDKTSSTYTYSAEYDQWTTLDSIVLQWTYSTISIDLLAAILEPDSIAMTTYSRLADIFLGHSECSRCRP